MHFILRFDKKKILLNMIHFYFVFRTLYTGDLIEYVYARLLTILKSLKGLKEIANIPKSYLVKIIRDGVVWSPGPIASLN